MDSGINNIWCQLHLDGNSYLQHQERSICSLAYYKLIQDNRRKNYIGWYLQQSKRTKKQLKQQGDKMKFTVASKRVPQLLNLVAAKICKEAHPQSWMTKDKSVKKRKQAWQLEEDQLWEGQYNEVVAADMMYTEIPYNRGRWTTSIEDILPMGWYCQACEMNYE